MGYPIIAGNGKLLAVNLIASIVTTLAPARTPDARQQVSGKQVAGMDGAGKCD
jgi:hypothetical protein